MTQQELKDLIANASSTTESLKRILAPNVDDAIVNLLQALLANKQILQVILPLIQVSVPTMTMAQLEDELTSLINLITTVKKMIVTGEIDHIEAFLNRLDNRPILLALLAPLF